jgi:hypothetical protein
VFFGLIPNLAMPATFSLLDMDLSRLSIALLFSRRIATSTSSITDYLMEASAPRLGKPDVVLPVILIWPIHRWARSFGESICQTKYTAHTFSLKRKRTHSRRWIGWVKARSLRTSPARSLSAPHESGAAI